MQAGAFDAALDLLAVAEAGPLERARSSARVDLLRAQLAFVTNRGGDAPPLLLKAARRLEPIDAGLARATYLDALAAAMFAGRLAGPGGDAAGGGPRPRGAAPPAATTRRAPPICSSTAWRATSPRGTRRPCRSCGRRWTAFGAGMSADEELRWLWLACTTRRCRTVGRRALGRAVQPPCRSSPASRRARAAAARAQHPRLRCCCSPASWPPRRH